MSVFKDYCDVQLDFTMTDAHGIAKWENLPDHVILLIFSMLDVGDRYSASLSCQHWAEVFDKAVLWRHFSFNFHSRADAKQLKCLEKHGGHLKSVFVFVDPQGPFNCENLCRVITGLARHEERKLERIGIYFTTENPLFFQGNDILSSVAELFGPPNPKIILTGTLVDVDLSGLNISYTDILFNLLSSNHPNLEVLNIQNTSLSCQVSAVALFNLVEKCRKLRRLSCFYSSMCDKLMEAFTEKDRSPLEVLSFSCQREDKFHKHVSIESWDKITKALPKLRVIVNFDHTIERLLIHSILHHQIPLVELSLRTMSELHREVALVDSYFSQSLEKLTITTKGSKALEEALLNLVEHAVHLKALHCHCGLQEDVIEKIKAMKPNLLDCTLHTEEDVEGIVIGREARASVMDVSNYLDIRRDNDV